MYNPAVSAHPSVGPLDGVRVLELGSFIAGPFAGQLLGDYGAEVIKVESPDSGDPMRGWGVTRDGDSLWWPCIARNKKSVTLDLRHPGARALVPELAKHSHIVIENFRPGRLAEWGLTYDILSAENPQLVVVHVSGFGQTGPRANSPGFGSIGEAVGGIRHTTGDPGQPSTRTGISLGDSLAGLFGVIGAMTAFVHAEKTGEGQEVDVAIYEAVAALMESSMADFELGGVLRSRTGPILPGVAPSNAYPTADGIEVLIAANADAVFARLCKVMEKPELLDEFRDHESRGQRQEELDGIIASWTSDLPSEELLNRLDAAGVPAGPIFTAADMLTDAHYAARGMVSRVASRQGWNVPMPGVVPHFTRSPGFIRDAGPDLGEHTDEVLRGLIGLSPTRLAELRDLGCI